MYTLHVVASERRLAHIQLGSDRNGSPQAGRFRNVHQGTCSDSESDEDGALRDLSLDEESREIEFTAGNPRVEHITGVVHLYRPSPGRLPHNIPLTGAPAPDAATPGARAALASTPAAGAAPAPSKAASTWASLLAPPQRPVPPQPAPQSPPGEKCDQLCCLALPSDMTIADFCTFLGAHLSRLRQMRVLRRQVGSVSLPATHHPAATLPSSSWSKQHSAHSGSAAEHAAPSSTAASSHNRAPASASGEPSTEAEAAGAPGTSGTPSAAAQGPTGAARSGSPPWPLVRTPPRPPAPPALQRVVCMVVLRLESPEAAEELFADLNGQPFSSLEPDIVCRLVHVKDVEVTSGRASSAPGPPPPDAAAADAAASAPLPVLSPPPPPSPPPGQTELPTCPVCLERLDEHVSGIVTTVCNHMFHSECLQKWADTTCPVCRYCVQGAGSTSRCGVCGTAVDLWICLICGHVGCGRYRAGHAADHWRTSGHCYALELETQRVWDYAGDNYVHRLIQSKTDGKLVELAAPAAHPHAVRQGSGGAAAAGGHRHSHSHAVPGDASCCGAGGGGAGAAGLGAGGVGGGGRDAAYGGGGASASGAGMDGGGPGWSAADEELKEALMASKLDAIAAEYNHLLASQLDSQRQYFEAMVSQAALDADHRCAQAGAAADSARVAAEAAGAAAREEARRRQAAERKAAETAEALRAVRQEAEFLRSLNETLLANQKDFKQQLAAERARAEAAEAAAKELEEQVRDLAFFIEAQRTISDAAGGELREGTVLPLPQGGGPRAGRAGATGSGGRGGARGGGLGTRAPR